MYNGKQNTMFYGTLSNWIDYTFKINDITKSTSPIKIFEYMALHKPIVTTDMPECRKYKCVLIGHDRKKFLKR